eukprot:1105380-Heterocapsa_arctica.AAC.1
MVYGPRQNKVLGLMPKGFFRSLGSTESQLHSFDSLWSTDPSNTWSTDPGKARLRAQKPSGYSGHKGQRS